MWPRVVEVMLAVWLSLSPFIFAETATNPSPWVLYGLATAVSTLALLSYWRPTRRAHLGILAVALGMALWGRFAASTPPPPGYQNLIAVGLLLLMFALVPTDCLNPPHAWRKPKSPELGPEP